MSVVKDLTYVNKQTENPPHEVVEISTWGFIQIDGRLLEACKLERKNQGDTINAEFGMFVPGMIVKTVLSANLPAMMQAYHKRVKDIYGK